MKLVMKTINANLFWAIKLHAMTRNVHAMSHLIILMDNVMIRKVNWLTITNGGKAYRNNVLELNDDCNKPNDCLVANEPETTECHNGFCKCKTDYSPDSNQSRCIRPREKSKH